MRGLKHTNIAETSVACLVGSSIVAGKMSFKINMVVWVRNYTFIKVVSHSK